MITRLFLFVLGMVVLASCEKTVLLDLEQMPSRVVIQGIVTNKLGYQYVKVSRSVNFYESGTTPRVTDALVSVQDDQGQTFDFVHNPGSHPDSMGYYFPAAPFAGEIGHTYKLMVIVEDQLYEAEDRLFAVTTMDSIKYQINHKEQRDPMRDGRYFELLMYAKEPRETRDYYLFKFFRNDTLSLHHSTDIYFTDDKTLGEEINGIQSPVYYAKGDTARVEIYSLSRTGYVYFNDLYNLLNNDGGMFSPPAANPRTNISNGGLGFFQVSAVDVAGIKIEE